MSVEDNDPIFPDDDDDDDFADLFSFGADMDAPSEMASSSNGVISLPSTSTEHDCDGGENNSAASNDSFIELLENAQETELSLTTTSASGHVVGDAKKESTGELDLQEILDWLDDDDEKGSELLKRQEEELVFVQPPRPPSLEDSIQKAVATKTKSPPKPRDFSSLEEAVKCREASKSQIRRLLEREKFVVERNVRPHLWARMICDKTLDETVQSSLADSFQQWEEKFWDENFWEYSTTDEQNESSGYDNNSGATDSQSDSPSPQNPPVSRRQQQREWLEEQSNVYAERVLAVVVDGNMEFYKKAILAILVNHFDRGSHSQQLDFDNTSWKDALLPPVLCSILSSGVTPPVACVMLGQIIPSFMPVLALATNERRTVSNILHHQFYLLACYHLPLLALHLDKYLPNWYKCPPAGRLPQSWLVSHLAGESGNPFVNMRWLLHLWDLILTSNNNSLRFFLVIAILEFHAERLLLLTGEELIEEFNRVITFSSDLDAKNNSEVNPLDEDRKAVKWVQEWSDKAVSLWEETPFAVIEKLKVLEDEAVTDALIARQKVKEEKLRLQQEAEEKAMQEAREAEKERKEDEARKRLTRARLVAFYRQHNPGKETNIDKIMVSYDGRYDVLDAKLKMKYGVGFNPALKPKPIALTKSNKKLFATMNTGFAHRKSIKKRDNQETDLEMPVVDKSVVVVPPSEILPTTCWSKDANKIKLSKLKKSSKMVNDRNERNPVKFYVVDSRPESALKEQGRLPTSVSLSPDNLTDSKTIIDQETMLESLRGSVHLCIMGEGYSSLPKLYDHKITSELSQLIREDEERINTCARFLLSRGFPFVSIMEGGFASAHAYLCREGPKIHLNVNSVLIDYDSEVSLFGRFEKLHSMSGRDKAQRALQNLFDSSMTALTKKSKQLETMTSGMKDDHNQSKPGSKNAVKRFFDKNEPMRQNHGSLRNSFAQKMQTMRDGKSFSSQSGDFTDLHSLEIVDKSSPSPTNSQSENANKAATEVTANNSRPQQNSIGLAGISSRLKKSSNAPPSPTKGVATKSPFSRFGSLSIGQSNKRGETSSGPAKSKNFAGSINKFKSTMARIRTAETQLESNERSDTKLSPSPAEPDKPVIAKV